MPMLAAHFLAIFVSVGCSNSHVSAKGLVRVGGKPAAGAVLIFLPEGGNANSRPASAIAAEDGSFLPVTGDTPGLPAGNYRVSVVWPDTSKQLTEAEKMMGASIYDGPDKLEGRYSSPDSSELKVEVKAGMKELPPLDLK